MTTDLIKQEVTPKDVFKPNGLDMILSVVEEKVHAFMGDAQSFDVSKKKDREKISSFAYQVSRSKTFVDEKGKKYVAEIKKKTKEIDAERKRFRDIMDSHRDKIKEPVTKWEAEEDARVEAERQLEIYLMEWDEALAENNLFDREREIRIKEEEMAKAEADRKAKEEAERLEKERIEREARIAKEAEERAKQEAEEKIQQEREAKEQAERDAKEAADRAEREKQAAIEQAKREAQAEAERAEQSRIAKEAEKRAEAERKSANKRHQASVNNKVKEALMVVVGLDEETAKKIVVEAARGNLAVLRVEY